MMMYALMSLGLLFFAYMAVTYDSVQSISDVATHITQTIKKRYVLEGVALYVTGLFMRKQVRAGAGQTIQYDGHTVHVDIISAEHAWIMRAHIRGERYDDQVTWRIEKGAESVVIKHLEGIE